MTRDAAAGRGSPFEPGSDQAALWKEEEEILYHQTRTFGCAEILKQIQVVERTNSKIEANATVFHDDWPGALGSNPEEWKE